MERAPSRVTDSNPAFLDNRERPGSFSQTGIVLQVNSRYRRLDCACFRLFLRRHSLFLILVLRTLQCRSAAPKFGVQDRRQEI